MNANELMHYAKLACIPEKLRNEFLSPTGRASALERAIRLLEASQTNSDTERALLQEYKNELFKLERSLLNKSTFTGGIRAAARVLFDHLRCPILAHVAEGAWVQGLQSTLFVPSPRIKPNRSVGAGDTMLGALALALAVEKRLECSNAPRALWLSMEECLLFAQLVTCFRLSSEKESFPNAVELYSFALSTKIPKAPALCLDTKTARDRVVVEQLSRSADPNAPKLLERFLSHDSYWVRFAAYRALEAKNLAPACAFAEEIAGIQPRFPKAARRQRQRVGRASLRTA